MIRQKRMEGLGRDCACVVLGSVGFGVGTSEQESFEIMDAYAAMGGNFIDTARIYGDFARGIQGISESVIGKWMESRGNRADIVVGTKGGHPDLSDMKKGRLDKENLSTDIRLSLDSLRSDYADIYWLHRDDVTRPVGDIMETLNGFLSAGYCRAIGASNWTTARIAEANEYCAAHGMVGFTANQPQWSLAEQTIVEDETLCKMDSATYEFHRSTGLPVVCFSSQAKGFFIKLHDGGEASLPDKAKRRFYTPQNLAIYDRLLVLSRATGYSVGALSLGYLTNQPFPVFPIAGVSSLKQAAALQEAGECELTPEQVEWLRKY